MIFFNVKNVVPLRYEAVGQNIKFIKTVKIDHFYSVEQGVNHHSITLFRPVRVLFFLQNRSCKCRS